MIRFISAKSIRHFVVMGYLLLNIHGFFWINSGDRGELLGGTPARVGWKMEAPAGMAFIPGGSFTIGSVAQDPASRVNPSRQVAISGFYMDTTATTNNQYRKFINSLLKEAKKDTDELDEEEELEEGLEENDELEEEDDEEDDDELEDESMSEAFIMGNLYPDMTRWQKDFGHQMSDPMVEKYYEHVAFDNFPVVGITWEAAKAFADWRTDYLNKYRKARGLWSMPKFRLPTASEWTYAARGGKAFAKYPWGESYVRNERGELMANFKASRGDYKGDSEYDYTAPVDHFPANGYGLHMGGNVFEWTVDAYSPIATVSTWDLNPVFLDDKEPHKIIKGGSWNSIARFMQTDVVDYEHKDQPRSFIGFRCVMSHIGEGPAEK